ncbi:MAG: acetyltransferase [Desulfurispora sp.]|uniref:acetyltransferase n=1 Tax=Desulfurispora sp. TaxID=3014275 RepID=UPI00404A8868
MLQQGLLILGFGGHARSVGDVALRIGFTDLLFVEQNAQQGESFHGFKVVKELPLVIPENWLAFAAAGDYKYRMQQLKALGLKKFPIATIISPLAYVGLGTTVAAGTFVAHKAYLGPMVSVGSGCIINTGAIVEHDCKIGDFSHISINATIAGKCTVGKRVFIGAGATIIDKVNIADDVIIGAGATVVDDISEPGVYVGVPAKQWQTKLN